MSTTVSTHYLDVPGASIYYEVRGSGPLLALIGAPMGSSGFAALAELMASQYTVLTYDPRGSEHSTVTDRTEITTPELLAEDVYRVLDSVSDEPAAIVGSSGGAVTGLALVTGLSGTGQRPGRTRAALGDLVEQCGGRAGRGARDLSDVPAGR